MVDSIANNIVTSQSSLATLSNVLPDLEPSLQIVGLLFILSFLPIMVVSMTPFLRIILVMSLLKQALGTQNSPPTMVIVGLGLFLTGYILGPELNQMNTEALIPLANKQIKVKALFVPYYFFIMNLCMYLGFIRFLRGKQSANWERAKRA